MISSLIFTTALPILGIYAHYLVAICTVESSLINSTRWHDGGSPSYGLCQVKARTANWVTGNTKLNFLSLINPVSNAYHASRYLEYLFKRYPVPYRIDCAISAYNAGNCSLKGFKTYVRRVRRHI